MGYVDRYQPVYISGIKSFVRPDQAYPVLHPEDQGLILGRNGHTTAYYMSRAKKEKALIVGISGLNSHFLLSEEEIGYLNDRGYSVIWMANPLPARDGLPFMKDNTDLARLFLTHPHSPINMFSPSLPRYIFTHSTGGQIFLSLMHEPDTRRTLKEQFYGAAHMAPFLDSANASIAYPVLQQRIWEAYCHANRMKRSEETFLGRLYLKYIASHEHYAQDSLGLNKEAPKDLNGPTYGHIIEVQKYGRALIDKFNPSAVNEIQQIFVVGDQDKFACPKAAQIVAQNAGIETIVVHGAGHDPIRHQKEPRDYLLTKVDKCVEAHEKLKANKVAFQYIPAPTYSIGSEDLPDIELSLGDRARAALQGGAGFLNAGTGFFQGLLAGGVRNPEVR